MSNNLINNINTYILSLKKEYKNYNVEQLKLAHITSSNMYNDLLNYIPNSDENDIYNKISQKLIIIIGIISKLYDDKEYERILSLPNNERDNILKIILDNYNDAFIGLLFIYPENLVDNNNDINNMMKLEFEKYIKDYEKILLILDNYEIKMDNIKNFQKEAKCKITLDWIKKNKNIFNIEIYEKLFLKLTQIDKHILEIEEK